MNYNGWMLIRDVLYGTFCIGWILTWVTGVVIAKGFISTSFAVCTGGLYSLYLIVEKFLPLF